MSRYARRIAGTDDDQHRAHQWQLFMGQFWRWHSLTGDPPEPPNVEGLTRAGEYTSDKCEWMSDDLLDAALEEEAADPLAQLAICHELDRRNDQRKAEAAAAEAELERCYAWLRGTADEVDDPILNPARRKAPTRAEQAATARQEYDLYVYNEYLRAEDECNGVLLNERGRAKHISPLSLFSGNASRVEAYASPELQGWFNSNGRMTFSAFRYHVMGWQSDKDAARRSRLESFDAPTV